MLFLRSLVSITFNGKTFVEEYVCSKAKRAYCSPSYTVCPRHDVTVNQCDLTLHKTKMDSPGLCDMKKPEQQHPSPKD